MSAAAKQQERLLGVPEVAAVLGVTVEEARRRLALVKVVRIGLGRRQIIRVEPHVVDLINVPVELTPVLLRRRLDLHETCLRKYQGFSLRRYDELLARQGGACAVCRRAFVERGYDNDSPCIDHCHQTGRVRGLLCGPCNRGLGHFQDNAGLIRQAAAYLESGGDHGSR